jgi:hypothetical protein
MMDLRSSMRWVQEGYSLALPVIASVRSHPLLEPSWLMWRSKREGPYFRKIEMIVTVTIKDSWKELMLSQML